MQKQAYDWCDAELTLIKEQGLYRQMRTISTGATSVVRLEESNQILGASNNYLGLATDPRLIEKAKDAMDLFGIGSGGSRLTTGNTTIHEQLEARVAAFKQAEAGIIFSSGYLANIGVISALATSKDVILSDSLNHASIIDGCRLSKAKTVVYRHVDMQDLELRLKESADYEKRIIVTDGVFSMDGNIAPLQEIMALANKYDAFVIVDDAHATGVLGPNGKGTAEHCGVSPDITIGTFSKAVGTEGGFAVGRHAVIELLKNKARSFIFQTSMPPSTVAATIEALTIIEKDRAPRERLRESVKYTRQTLLSYGFQVIGEDTPIIPVIIGDPYLAVQFAKELEDKGIYAPAIRPPTVPIGESRIRMTIMASHTNGQLEQICNGFYQVGKKLGVI